MIGLADATANPRTISRQPERLYTIRYRGEGAAGRITNGDHLAALEQHLVSTENIAYLTGVDAEWLLAGDKSVLGRGHRVSPHYFQFLGVRPIAGRVFGEATADDDAAGSAVISEQVWYSLFDADPRLERLSFRTEGSREVNRYQVVGVVPAELVHEMGANFWVVMPRDVKAWATTLQSGTVTPIVRLREHATVDSLIANLRTVAEYQTSIHGHGRIEFVYISRPISEEMMDAGSGLNWLLAVAAAVVLIIACSNLANLVLARGLGRRHEMAVRMSLGARRADLVRDVIAECLVIALAGAVLGMIAAAWGFDVMRRSLPERIPYAGVLVLTMNWRVIVLSVGAAVISAVLFGLLPALRLSSIHLAEHVKEHAGTTTARRRNRFPALVIGQVAISLALLAGVSLLLRASAAVQGVDLGFDPSRLADLSFFARGDTTLAARQATLSAVETRLRGTTGVEGVAWAAAIGTRGGSITGERSGGAYRTRPLRSYQLVHPDYLRVVGIRVIRGRDLAPRDALGEGAVVIDSATALRIWGSEDPVGKLVKFAEEGRIAPWYRVVGVSRPIRPSVPEFDGQEAPPQVFLARGAAAPRWASFAVRTRGATSQLMLGDLRAVVRDALPPRTQTWARRFDEDRQMLLEGQRFLSRIFGTFGVIALALCALGLYSVLAHSVSQRTREHGIRVALGATPRVIFRDVLREGGVLVLGGTALGGLATIWTNRLVDPYISMLYHVDALALVAAESVLVMVALLAILRPALRATRSDPVEVLRAA